MDDQLHLLTGAYALNALDDDERRRFEGTLAFGDPTAEEARELAETAALLAAGATPVAPPPDLKARLMAQIAVTPQLDVLDEGSRPDVAGSRPDVVGSRPDVAGSRPAAPGPAPAGGDSQEVTPRGGGGSTVADLGERRRRASQFPSSSRWLAAAAAVLLVSAGGAGVWGLQVQKQRDDALRQLAVAANAPSAGMGRILAAPDAKVQEVSVPGGGTMLIVHSQTQSVGGVMTVGMPATPPGHVYELWLEDTSGTMQPAGLMPGGGGTTWNELTGGIGSSTAIGVTVEPAGGSPAPTTPPILVKQFS
ncbi:anti-sigma factor domain-containing protein [Sinomonas flava]|uniref:anti-sigma factor domain-containing protein n=1 Tax=Sinomonas flava TaxID=496857 RepID=UPI0039A5EC98